MKKRPGGITRTLCAFLAMLTISTSFTTPAHAQEITPDDQEEIVFESEEASEEVSLGGETTVFEKDAVPEEDAFSEGDTFSEDEELSGEFEAEPEEESRLTGYTFKWSDKLLLNADEPDENTDKDEIERQQGFGTDNGKDFYILKDATGIQAKFYVAMPYTIARDENDNYLISVTCNGKKIDSDAYTFYYDEIYGGCEFSMQLPEDEDGNVTYGNIVLNATTVSTLTKYSFKWTNTKLSIINESRNRTEDGSGISGIGTVNGKDYYITENASEINATFKVDKQFMLDRDDEGNYKVSATYNGKDITTVEGGIDFSYDREEALLDITISLPQDDQFDPIPGNLVLNVTTVSVMSKYSFKWTGSMKLSNDEGEEPVGIISSNGKDYTILRDSGEISGTFLLDKTAVISKDADGDYKISASYNGKKITGEGENDEPYFEYYYDRSAGTLKFSVRFATDDNDNIRLANIVINATTESKKLFTFSGKCGDKSVMTIDTSVSEDGQTSMSGLVLVGGKYYFDSDDGSISATFKYDDGYVISRNSDGDYQYKVTVGSTVIDTDNYSGSCDVNVNEETNTITFYCSTTFTNDATTKEVLGNISFSVTFLTALTNYTFTYNTTYLTPDESDPEKIRGLVKKSGKYYVKRYADDIAMTFKVKDGYYLQQKENKDGWLDYKATVKYGTTATDDYSIFTDYEEGTLDFSMNLVYYDEVKEVDRRRDGNISFTGTFATFKKATFTWNSDEIESISTDGVGKLSKDNNAVLIEEGIGFEIQIETKPGYEVKKVTYGKGELKPKSDYEFVYKIPNVSGDQKITITTGKWTKKELEPVQVEVLINDEAPSEETALVEFTSGVTYDADKKQYYTEKSKYGKCSKIEFKLKLGKGKKDDGWSRALIGIDGCYIESSEDNYSLCEKAVLQAMISGETIIIKIDVVDRPFNLTFTEDDRLYYREIEENYGEYGPQLHLVEALPGEDFAFTVHIAPEEDENYELTGVTCNGKKMEALQGYGVEYYVLKNIREDCEITAQVKKIDKRKTITVIGDDGVNNVRARIDGNYVEGTTENGQYQFKAEIGEKVTFEIEVKDHYEVVAVEASGDTEVSLYGDEAVLYCDGDTTLSIITEGIPALYLKKLTGDKSQDYCEDDQTIHATSSDKFELSVRKGKENLKIEAFKLEGIVEKTQFATLSEDGKSIVISCDKAEDVSDIIRVFIICQDLSGEMSIGFDIEQSVKKITLEGFKENTASQLTGTQESYGISVNSGAKLSDVTVELLSGSDKNASVSIDYDKEELVVKTFKGNALARSDIKLVFKNRDKKVVGEAYVIQVSKPSLGVPSVKALSVTDVNVTLMIDTANAADYKNTYVKVIANAITSKKSPLAEGMSENVTRIYKVAELEANQGVVVFDLATSGVQKGSGAAQKYNISVSLLQLNDTAAFSAGGVEDEKIVTEGNAKEISVSTIKPKFAKKLTLKAKKKSLTIGESDITVASYSFTKGTTFRTVTKATLTGSAKNDTYSLDDKNSVIELAEDGKSIILTDSSKLYPGTYVLMAYPEGEGKPGKLKIKVKAPVTDITIDAASDQVVKLPKKGVSIKIKTTVKSVIDGEEYKPANKKVKVTFSSDNEELLKRLSYKDGKIKISKKYVLSEDPSMNEFTVIVTAKDLTGKGTPATASKTFTITE